MRLFNEKGTTYFSAKAVLENRIAGDPEQVRARYERIIAALGEHCTELGRDRTIEGISTSARTVKATHAFIFPPQAGVVLTEREGNNLVNAGTRREHLVGLCQALDVGAAVGVSYNATSSPPSLEVYNLTGMGTLNDLIYQAIGR